MSDAFDEVNRKAAQAAGMTEGEARNVQQALRGVAKDMVTMTCMHLRKEHGISYPSTCASILQAAILQAAILALRELVPHAPIFDWIRAIADASETAHAGRPADPEQVDRLHRLVIEMQQHARAAGEGGGGTVQ